MKKGLKASLIGIGLFAGVLILSGCTASFTRPVEKARIMAAYETGISEFYTDSEANDLVVSENYKLEKVNDLQNVWQYSPADDTDLTKIGSSQLQKINSGAFSSGIYLPSIEFFREMDVLVLKKAIETSGITEYSHETFSTIMEDYGYLKYFSDNNEWKGFTENIEKKSKKE